MKKLFRGMDKRQAFTIIELVVVIAVIGILVGIVAVSYGAWQKSTRVAQVKAELNAIGAAMESARNFTTGSTSGYPTSIPTSFTPNADVTLTPSFLQLDAYCIDAVSNKDSTVVYYLYSKIKDNGPQEGTCATRPDVAPPANLASGDVSIVGTGGTTATVTWPSVSDATSYIVQCASDPGFIYNPQQASVTAAVGTMSGVVEGLTPSTTFYCRVKSMNTKGASGWSPIASANTNSNYGNLPVATSIEGYWTSAPQGFLLEDGSAVSRTTFAALFAAIGTTYGSGDGSTTFNLPDSRGRTTVNRNTSDAEFATIGQVTGSKAEQLTIATMPSHTHIQNPHDHNQGNANPYVTAGGSGIPVTSAGGSAFGFRYNTSAPSPSTVATNQNTGGNGTHNNIQPSIVKMSAIKFSQADTAAASLPAGSSISGYYSSTPTGYLQENGAAVSRTTYAALFAAIGTTYGAGNGSTTFNVPDSRGRASANLSASDSEFDTMGEKPGSKTETLTVSQIPSHTHTQNAHNHGGGYANPFVTDSSMGSISVSSLAGSAFGYVLRPGPSTTATNQNTGGDGAHNNIQPSITKMSYIKATAASGTLRPVAPGTSVGGYFPTAPSGYLYEDGSEVSRVTYADLFAVIGTTYGGGDGSTTFNLPDSRGRIGVNFKSGDSEFGTMGQTYGEKSHIITIAEMPTHTHIQNAHDHNSGGIVYISDGSFGGTQTMTASGGSYGFRLAAGPNATATNQSTGGGQAHNEIQPTITKYFVIKY